MTRNNQELENSENRGNINNQELENSENLLDSGHELIE